MDATLAGVLTTGVTSFQTMAFSTLTSNLPVAFTIAATIGVVFFGWRIVRAVAHI